MTQGATPTRSQLNGKDGICSLGFFVRRAKSKMTANVPCKNCYKICAEICQKKPREKQSRSKKKSEENSPNDKSPTLMMIFLLPVSCMCVWCVCVWVAGWVCVAKQLIKIKNDFIIYFSSDNGRHDEE